MWKDSEIEIDYLDFLYIDEIMKDTINDAKTAILALILDGIKFGIY